MALAYLSLKFIARDKGLWHILKHDAGHENMKFSVAPRFIIATAFLMLEEVWVQVECPKGEGCPPNDSGSHHSLPGICWAYVWTALTTVLRAAVILPATC